MESYLTFFEEMPTWGKLVWIFICLSLATIIELITPLFRVNYQKGRHARVNLVFLFTSLLINILFGAITVGIYAWIDAKQFGILHWMSAPLWALFVVGIFALDFAAQWLAHYMLHHVRWMWLFHLVHHSDTHVDATTGTRHHPGDYAIREVFSLLTVILFGIPMGVYILYKFSSVLFTYLTHANIELPLWFDKALSWVFVSPNMHKFHHHYERPWTDTNYGNIFSIWDRLLGTFVYEDVHDVHYGIDVLDDSLAENLPYQFRIPWNKHIKTD